MGLGSQDAIRVLFYSLIVLAALFLLHPKELRAQEREGPDTKDDLIVFVHGLFGNAETWSNAETDWPTLIRRDPDFSSADVYVYEYPTGDGSRLTPNEIAADMRIRLRSISISDYKSVSFIAHSMGGVVTREYILQNRNIASRTRLLYLFAVPTAGSEVANIASVFGRNPQIRGLRTMTAGSYLADVQRNWFAAGFEFAQHCAYETRRTYGLRIVVSQASAASLCRDELIPINADHIDIVKPDGPDALPYVAFKDAFFRQSASQACDALRSELQLMARLSPERGIYLTQCPENIEAARLALRAFRDQRYADAAQLLEVADDAADDSGWSDLFETLRTPSFFGAGLHFEGLVHICEKYLGLPPNDHRYRHDIHAHLRAIAWQKGQRAALSTIRRLHESEPRCRSRADISPVWLGISLDTMRQMAAGSSINLPSPSEADQQFVRGAISPNQPFAAYAYLSIGEFDVAYDSQDPHKHYIEEEIAFYRAVNEPIPRVRARQLERYVDAYPNGRFVQDSHRLLRNFFVSVLDIERARLHEKMYFDPWCSSEIRASVVYCENSTFRDAYRSHFYGMNDLNYLIQELDIQQAISVIEEFQDETRSLFGRPVSAVSTAITPETLVRPVLPDSQWTPEGRLAALDALVAYLEDLEDVLDRFDKQEITRRAKALKRCGDVRALSEPSENVADAWSPAVCGPLFVGTSFRSVELDSAASEPNEAGFITYAVTNFSYHHMSISLMDTLIASASEATEVADIIYLVGMSHKRLHEYEEMYNLYNQMVDQLGNHPLRADIIAEMGWYKMAVERDFIGAERYFRRVIDEFPDDNAFDNALNWMVILNRERGHYWEALQWSLLLSAEVGSQRLEGVNLDRLQDVAAVAGSLGDRANNQISLRNVWTPFFGSDEGPSSVEVAWVAPGSVFDNGGVRAGDRLRSIDGEYISDIASIGKAVAFSDGMMEIEFYRFVEITADDSNEYLSIDITVSVSPNDLWQ